MSLYEFSENDIFNNRIKTHPRSYFVINNKKIYYNSDILPLSDQAVLDGTDETIHYTEQGYLSLYELNVNRNVGAGGDGLVYPFITKQGTLENFSTVSTEDFQGFSYGTIISGSYPMSSSISSKYYALNSERPRVAALKNTMEYYKPLSPHYEYVNTTRSLATTEMRLISIPSIFYGSSIKKGSVKLNFYVTGSLVATIEDKHRNGELIQTFGLSTPGSSSTGSLQMQSSSIFMLNTKRLILEDASGNSVTFIFDTSGSPSTGATDGSGNIVIQVNGMDGDTTSQATEVKNAINSVSSLGITANSTGDVINLSQDTQGTSGDTTIGNPDAFDSNEVVIVNFTGGQAGTSTDPNDGKVAGVVLYNEGFVSLTGSWDISSTLHTEDYLISATNIAPKWTLWGQRDYTAPSNPSDPFAPSSSWDISFLGTNYIPTLTMLAHAKQGDLNHSNNPTYIDFEDKPDNIAETGLSSNKYLEDSEKNIVNIVKSQYANHSASFEKTTYISKIGIYDKDKNLIGVAKLATPVRKTESRSYTFKMKLDF